ncbi:putative toxin [Mycobacterium ahvazicum]|uniref:putative toxin n=1 Tax=Mycobacterium ahvazicum TaxID=1964395 RepID=UPI000BB75BD5|nr:putative toxin [Mycobacterium ahvazicum]
MTDVDPELFYDAAAAYKENSDHTAAALNKLTGVDAANAAGTHGVGPQWATAYDAAADEVGQVAYRLVNAFHNLGSLLRQDGVNHDETEDASTLNQRDAYGAPVTPPGESAGTFIDAAVKVSSVAGGGDPEPPHWDLVRGQITDGWPDGHPDHALSASAAWETFGHDLVGIDDQPGPEEQRLIVDVEAAEIAFVIDRLNEARMVSTDIAGACGDMSRAAKDYGNELKSVKDDMAFIVKCLYLIVTALDAYPPQLHLIAEAIKNTFIATAVTQINGLNAALRVTATASMKDLGVAGTAMGTALPAVKSILALVPRSVTPTPTQRVNDNRRKGRRAEEIAGIDQTVPKQRIQIVDPNTGKTRYRIPDELDRDNHVVREVKNVQKLRVTQQIRDFAEYAQERGFKFVIVVDKGRTDYQGALETLQRDYQGLQVEIDDSRNLS